MNYRFTPTAETHFWKALRDTTQKWGAEQAEKYRVKFLKGLQKLSKNHHYLNSSHRKNLTKGTEFSINLVEHQYGVFVESNNDTIIIAGIFHKNMDIPARLIEFKGLAQSEIDTIRKYLL